MFRGLKILHLTFFVIIPLVLINIWFRSGLTIGGGDEPIIFYNPTRSFKLFSGTWQDYATGFSTLVWLSRLPFLYFIYLLHSKLNISGFVIQAGTYFILMTVGTISFYYLILKFLDNYKNRQIVSFVAALFYLLNPYSMSQVWGRGLYAQHFSFALLPLSLLLFVNGLRKKSYIYAALIALVSIPFGTSYGFMTFALSQWLVFLLYSVFLIRSNQKSASKVFVFSYFLLILILWIGINFWWLAPLLTYGGISYSTALSNAEENIGTLLGVSVKFPFNVLIRLLSKTYFGSDGPYGEIYSTIPFQIISYVFPVCLGIGIYKIFKTKFLKALKYFVLVFAISLVVSLGANKPLGWLFVLIFKSVPFLQIFRNSFEKFGLVYVLGYAPLFAIGAIRVVDYISKRFFSNKSTLPVVTFLSILLFGVFAWPMWTGRVIAGPDKKIGIPVPSYYKQLENWMNSQDEDYPIFMTPFWGGEGAIYKWDETRYQGVDPITYIIDKQVVSSSLAIPFYYDFVQNIRRYMGSINVVPSLQLLRTKYLVDRKDAAFESDSDRKHLKFLTEAIYPPSDKIYKSVCQDVIINSEGVTPWIICQINGKERDLSKVKYLTVVVKTDIPAALYVSIRDESEKRIGWDGRKVPEYQTKDRNLTEIILPISSPSEQNIGIDLSKIYLLEIMAYPKDAAYKNVSQIVLDRVRLDLGREQKISEFTFIKQIGKLDVYEQRQFSPPPKFGILSRIETINSFQELFKKVNGERDTINVKGFSLAYQNPSKDLNFLSKKSLARIVDATEITNTRYWIKLEGKDEGFITLAKTFNPEWKVLPGVDRDLLGGIFFNDLRLIFKTPIHEENHFVINGYANLWRVDRENSNYAIVFMPDVVRDLSVKVSIFFTIIIAVIAVYQMIRKTVLDS